jgi:TRAP-type C4-dicarboxylate transport system permease small subunit
MDCNQTTLHGDHASRAFFSFQRASSMPARVTPHDSRQTKRGGIILKFSLQECLKIIPGLLLAVMAVTVFIGVVFRYVFHSPLSFPEELAKLAFTWVVFLGAAIAAAKKEHIVIETLVEFFPTKVRAALGLIIRLLTIIFLGVVAFVGIQYLFGTVEETSAAMEISMAWWALPIPISALFIIWYTFTDIKDHVFPALLGRQEK